MVTFNDTDSFFVYYGLPFAILSAIAACFTRAVRILQITVTTQLAFLLFFVLHNTWPNVFPMGSLVMSGVIFATVGGILILIYCMAASAIYIACLTIAVPILTVNSLVIADKYNLPIWAGVAVFCALAAVAVAILVVSRILDVIGIVLKVSVTSVILWVHIRMTYLENPPALDQTQFACAEKGYNDRCPVSLVSLSWFFILLSIMLVQLTLIFEFGCCKPTAASVNKAKAKKKQERLQKSRKSPSPPPEQLKETLDSEEEEEVVEDMFERDIRDTEREKEKATLLCKGLRRRYYRIKYSRCNSSPAATTLHSNDDEDLNLYSDEEEAAHDSRREADELRRDDKYAD